MFVKTTAAVLRPLSVCAVLTGLLLSSASADEGAEVVAKVGDGVVTEADIAFAAQDFSGQLQRVPPAQWKKVLTDVVVDMKVMAEAATAEGIADDPDFKRQVSFLTMRALRNAYFVKEVEDKITEADVKAAYDKQFADFEGEIEVQARHILLKTKEEAEAVIKELDSGADFAELAKEKSTGPSGPAGGDLGYFTKGRMVKPFDDAVFAMETGDYTKEPVETQFGWHVIKVEDKRNQPAPAFSEVADQLRQELARARFEKVMADLKAKTKIEIIPAADSSDASSQDDEKAESEEKSN